jgi:excinuclease ABC subunit A
VKVDGEQHLLEEPPTLDRSSSTRSRWSSTGRDESGPAAALAQSVQAAAALADGLVVVDVLDGDELTFSETSPAPSTASTCRLEPRIFSFNSPHGACPRCTGLGAQQEIDPDLLVPTGLSIGERARAWSLGNSSFYESVIQAIADRCRSTSSPLAGAPTTPEPVPVRHRGRQGLRPVPQPNGRKRSYMLAFEASSRASSAATRRPT